jgi:circadian clock protein KaiB
MTSKARQAVNPIAARAPAEAQSYRLYISSASPISSRAIVNARRFFEASMPGRYRLAILNIADHVKAARRDQIVASPTLIRIAPLPQRRFIGDLSDAEQLRRLLGIAKTPVNGS